MTREIDMPTSRRQARTLLILAGALVLAVGFGLLARTLSEAESAADASAASSAASLLGISAEDIAELAIENDAGSFTLVRGDGGESWSCAETPDELLDASCVEAIATSLAEATYTRIISDEDATEDMSTSEPDYRIAITLSGGEAITLSLSMPSASATSCYAQLSSSDDVMVVDSDLADDLDFELGDLLAREAAPKASTITSLTLERTADADAGSASDSNASASATTANMLTLYHNSLGFDELYTSEYTWAYDEGAGLHEANASEASSVAALVNQVSWATCITTAANGAYDEYFADLTLRATLTYEVDVEDEDESENGSEGAGDDGESENAGTDAGVAATTTETYVLEVGTQAADGSYYARPLGSNAVYTLSADDVEELLETSGDTLAPDDVCLMDWDSVTSLDVTVDGESFTITFQREAEGEGDDTEIVTTYFVSDEEADELDVEDVLDLIDGLDAEGEAEGEADQAQLAADAEVTLTFHRDTQAHATMTLTLTRYDNSFYRVSFNGESRLLVSKNDVAELKEALKAVEQGT